MPQRLLVAAALLAGGGDQAQSLVLPTPDEAKAAVIAMMNDADLARLLAAGQVRIGTCKAASKGTHPGEVACTIALVMGAGSSETQADFYRDIHRGKGDWVATPSEEDLPFPDPRLR